MNVLSLFDGISCGRVALERAGCKVSSYYASEVDKHAIKVSKENHDDIIHIGDVRDVKAADLPKIDLLIGGSPCFVAGTEVYTSEGKKSIENVKVGDYVLTHKNRFKKVLRTGGQVKQVIKVFSQGNTPTYTTKNHPFYVKKQLKRKWNGEKKSTVRSFSNPKWIKAGELSKGDYLGTFINKENSNPLNITKEEAYILGLYLGDGHTRKDYRTSEKRPNHRQWQLIISVSDKETELFKSKISDHHYSFYPHTKSVNRAVFSSKRLVELAESLIGCGAINKRISKKILDLPKNILERFLEGYEFADGSHRLNEYRATTVSKRLVEDLVLVIAKLYETTCSIVFTKRPRKTFIEGREVNQNDTWMISYRKYHTIKSRAFVQDGIVWNPFKSMENISEEMTYNIEVEEDNSYVANNIIVHNCQGFSFSGKQLNFNDPRSKLFFEFVRILKETNPRYWMLENVVMKQEYQDIISDHLGVQPKKLNSALTSAQNRVRLYWANFEITEPKDKGIKLEDILEDTESLNPSAIRGRRLNKGTILGRRLDENGKRKDYDKTVPMTQCLEVRAKNQDKSNCLTTVAKDTVLTTLEPGRHPDAFKKNLPYRNYTKTERCRLMNLPDNYCDSISYNQTVKATGNGWEVGMVAHIFSHIK